MTIPDADIHAKGEDGYTWLHWMIFLGRAHRARALVAAGADVNTKSNDGETPLHIAAMYGHTDTAQALISAGAVKG